MSTSPPIGLLTPPEIGHRWVAAFQTQAPQQQIALNEAITAPKDIELLLVWKHPEGALKHFPNLRLLYSLGAGVDHLLNDPECPPAVPICRIVDPLLAFSMSNYIVYAVLEFQRRMNKYRTDQQERKWDHYAPPERSVRIGILGLGHLGQDAAKKLHQLGFDVSGYSPSKKQLKGITSYAGEQLKDFLQAVNVLVCTVPYTSQTHGLLNASLFKQLPKGSFLINVARGKVQNENDILNSLEQGHLAGAFLDVFETEPLPKESRLWNHPRISITPHIASITNPEAGVQQILQNWKRLQKGELLEHLVNPKKGY